MQGLLKWRLVRQTKLAFGWPDTKLDIFTRYREEGGWVLGLHLSSYGLSLDRTFSLVYASIWWFFFLLEV